MAPNIVAFDPLKRGGSEIRALGGYRLLRLLGRGGMSTVFLGYDPKTDTPVAVKVLADHLSFDPRFVRRFRREGHLARMTRHPNVARGIALGQDRTSGKHYLALEYIDGPSAQQVLDRAGAFPVPEACRIATEAGKALLSLHALRYLHRDVKPANLLLDSSGRAKLIDLGLAVRVDERDGLAWEPGRFGTPYYMPPEQAVGGRVDVRGDIFALAATLHHLLTGEVPFPGSNADEVMRKKLHGETTPAARLNPAVPERLSDLLARSLSADPAGRPASMEEFITEVHRFRGETAPSEYGAAYRVIGANVHPTPRTDELATTQPDPAWVRNELPAPSAAEGPSEAELREPPVVSRHPDRPPVGDAPRPSPRRWTAWVVAGLGLVLGSSVLGAAVIADGRPDADPADRLPLCPCEALSRDDGLSIDEMAEQPPAHLASSTASQSAEPCPPLPEMPALR